MCGLGKTSEFYSNIITHTSAREVKGFGGCGFWRTANADEGITRTKISSHFVAMYNNLKLFLE